MLKNHYNSTAFLHQQSDSPYKSAKKDAKLMQNNTIDFKNYQDDIHNNSLKSSSKKSATFNASVKKKRPLSQYSRKSEEYEKKGGLFAPSKNKNLVVENERLMTSILILNKNTKMIQDEFAQKEQLLSSQINQLQRDVQEKDQSSKEAEYKIAQLQT